MSGRAKTQNHRSRIAGHALTDQSPSCPRDFSASSFSSGWLGNCSSGKFHSARDRGVEDNAQLHGVGAIYS